MTIDRGRAGSLVAGLVSLVRNFRAAAHREGEHSVSGTKMGVLRLIRDDAARLGDLATQLMVAPSVASRAVDALAAEGSAERRPDPHDARACLVTITAHGRRRLVDREQFALGVVTDVLSDWTPAQADQAIRLLQRLDGQLAELFSRLDVPTDGPARLPPQDRPGHRTTTASTATASTTTAARSLEKTTA
jgi:DNA-binding MarR family transcriptional regulator